MSACTECKHSVHTAKNVCLTLKLSCGAFIWRSIKGSSCADENSRKKIKTYLGKAGIFKLEEKCTIFRLKSKFTDVHTRTDKLVRSKEIRKCVDPLRTPDEMRFLYVSYDTSEQYRNFGRRYLCMGTSCDLQKCFLHFLLPCLILSTSAKMQLHQIAGN